MIFEKYDIEMNVSHSTIEALILTAGFMIHGTWRSAWDKESVAMFLCENMTSGMWHVFIMNVTATKSLIDYDLKTDKHLLQYCLSGTKKEMYDTILEIEQTVNVMVGLEYNDDIYIVWGSDKSLMNREELREELNNIDSIAFMIASDMYYWDFKAERLFEQYSGRVLTVDDSSVTISDALIAETEDGILTVEDECHYGIYSYTNLHPLLKLPDEYMLTDDEGSCNTKVIRLGFIT